jgi:hypothetical protein
MRGIKPVLIIIPAVLMGIALSACSGSQLPIEKARATARIAATRNFGQELLFDKTIEIQEGPDALQALQKAAEVDTAYGGGFVNSINGISSQYKGLQSSRQDWFLYINGLMSNSGAGDYDLHEGDTELWDFHDWSFHQFTPAVTGWFPEPFLHGYGGIIRPTIIVSEGDFQTMANQIKNKLKDAGVRDVSIESAAGLTREKKETANIILLGTGDDPLIAELNKGWKRLGFWAHIENHQLIILDSQGQISASPEKECGLIQATQNPWNPNGTGAAENTVWMITGTDKRGVELAAGAVVDSKATAGAFAAAITEDTVYRLPRQ